MKTVDVFRWIDAFKDGMFVDVLWKRQLDEYSVDGVVFVELLDFGDELIRRDGARYCQLAAVNSELLASLRLHVYVGRRSRIVTNEDDCKTGMDTSCFQGFDFPGGLTLDVVGDFRPIDESCRHDTLGLRNETFWVLHFTEIHHTLGAMTFVLVL